MQLHQEHGRLKNNMSEEVVYRRVKITQPIKSYNVTTGETKLARVIVTQPVKKYNITTGS